MDAIDLARWQFAITTVYHFLFVPITIGLSAVVAGFHTAWVRTDDPSYYKLTKFFGKLFTINFAIGIVTGIVQEFQFGMNWSDYSRFVGDIFGAPLAFEALLTFFLESTFIGLWIFGWGRLPKKLHAATMWLVHLGTVLSAYFILAANSFMQNPVGYHYNAQTQRAEMTDFIAVLTNKVQLVTFPHVLFAAYMTAGALVMAVGLWHLRSRAADRYPAKHATEAGADLAERHGQHRELYRRATRVGAVLSLVAALGVVITGDLQGKVMTEVQPMKMATAEALYDTAQPAPFSLFTVGSIDGSNEIFSVKIPGLLGFLGHGDFGAEVEGINQLKAQAAEQYAGNPRTRDDNTGYVPNIPAAYWTFRLMMGLGLVMMVISGLALAATGRKAMARGDGGALQSRWWHWAILSAPLLPLFANSFGWLFTELGRQPWIVMGEMTTGMGVSPGVSTGEVLVSMLVFTLVYGALAVIMVRLFLRYIALGAEAVGEPVAPSTEDEDAPLAFAY